MKKVQIIPLCLLVSITGIGGGHSEAVAEIFKEADLSFSAGYRVDDLEWNIAGNIQGQSPNVLSELTWKDLEINQLRAKGQLVLGGSFPYFDTLFRGALSYGWIEEGENQDSDFKGDNRTLEYSRSNNNTNGYFVRDASLAVGPRFTFGSGLLTITPLGGYSYHEQNLNITEGFQTVSRSDLDADVHLLGPIAGLDSSYETQWYGPWVGVDLVLVPFKDLTLKGSFEYHWAEYEAEADWNLRTDFAHPVSFEQDADGDGIVVSAAVAYDIGQHWSIEASGDYLDFQTDPGISRTYVVSPTPGVAVTRLNEVNWESYSFMFGLTYRFF